jgi:protein TonB
MFESAKPDDRHHGIVYVLSLVASLFAHAVILCLLVIIPLIFFSGLRAEELVSFVYAPPVPPPALPSPSPPVKAAGTMRHVKIEAMLEAPSVIPKGLPPPDESSVGTIDPRSYIGEISGIRTSGEGGMGKGLTDLLATAPNVVLEPKPPGPKPTPIRVGAIEPSKLIVKVNPAYPELARRARVSGTVVLDALIDEEGNVSSVKVLSGHNLLVDAAVEAVKHWKYSPTVLNGEPVPILATVTVVFRLN